MEITEWRLPCMEWKPPLTPSDLTSVGPRFSLYGCIWNFRSYLEYGKWKIYLTLNSKRVENVAFFTVPFIRNKNGEVSALPSKSWTTESFPRCIIEMDRNEFSNYYKTTDDDSSVCITFYFVTMKSKQSPTKTLFTNSVETQTDTPSVSRPCQQIFSEDIEKLFDNAEHSDAVLKCEDRSFSVNRSILSIRSDVFAAMFRSKMTESQSGVVEITDITPSVLEQFLRYIYSGKLVLCMDTVFELYEASEKYAVLSLREECSSFMVNNLSEDTFCKILLLADMFSDTALFNSAVSFVSNRQIFLKTATWREFARKHTAVAVEVFIKVESE